MRSTPKGSQPVWHKLNRVLVALIAFVSLLLAALAFIPEIQRGREEKRKIDALENAIRNEESIMQKQKRELELLKTNPEYVEIIARDKMDLMKEGEVVFRIDAGAREKSVLDSTLTTEP